jgi:formylglycine-generating enzyme required for sulfatase activity
MVVVPAGSFTMGSQEQEKDRQDNEGPQHVVTIGKPFAVGKLHVTVDQFATFVRETAYKAGKCFTAKSFNSSGSWPVPVGSWRDLDYAQEGTHPVVCVSRNDAKAYVGWLAKKTGQPYRLLSEAEWEYAARGRRKPGTYPRFWFGDDEKDLCRHGNVRDTNAVPSNYVHTLCDDGYAYTSPAGHYQPNAFGLYDMLGNVFQETEDCWHDDYNGAPTDGSAWTTDCSSVLGNASSDSYRVTRGGSWDSIPRNLRSAYRGIGGGAGTAGGFRVARTLTP